MEIVILVLTHPVFALIFYPLFAFVVAMELIDLSDRRAFRKANVVRRMTIPLLRDSYGERIGREELAKGDPYMHLSDGPK